ncbi:thiamine phosphate synthase [Niameybacter massiliensis]|uniref:thiamine phosphate synthase n=1 Tax=Niameybacter massiliensis TaxID=1658108 RepID=UPI0006B41D9F|nr:thiamine phosphate synthase [Niameybacter massiliensis]
MILVVTNRKSCKDDFLVRIEAIARRKPYGILLREKDLSKEDYLELARSCQSICETYQVPLIVHSYIEVARELKIKAIHLPYDRFVELGGELQGFSEVGVSIHSKEEAKVAEQKGATRLIAGHIYETTCKPNLEPRGLVYLRDIVDTVNIPVFAIGGITFERIKEVESVGAEGICMMSMLMSCPEEKLNLLLK